LVRIFKLGAAYLSKAWNNMRGNSKADSTSKKDKN
jgi:hypothetical protein